MRFAALFIAVSYGFLVSPFQFASAGSVQTLNPVTNADGRLGQADILPGNTPGLTGEPWGQLAYDSGARINRWEFRWDRIESAPHLFDFTTMDQAVQSSRKYGLDVLGILIGTPGWATAAGQKPGNGLPSGLKLAYTDPNNLWADYIRETVGRYQGQVRYWEIWNEPDVKFFWSGSADAYFRLLKVAYQTIRSVDPAATVLIAGMVVPDLNFVSRLLDDAANDPQAARNHGYFDAAAWHVYGQARETYTNITNLQRLLAARSWAGTPIWVTEDGFPASNPNGESRQAAYVLQTVADSLAAGAAKVLVYRASDDVLPKTWGLISAQGVPRMGYVSFQVAAQYLAHTLAAVYAPTAGLERLTFYQQSQRVTMLWSRGLFDETVRLPAAHGAATSVDWLGNIADLPARSGWLHPIIRGAVYNNGIDPAGDIVGGPPLLIREDNTVTSHLTAAPAIASVPGTARRLIAFNPGTRPVSADVAAVAQPFEHVALDIAPHSLKSIDLDLLAGTSYFGDYRLASNRPLLVAAVSTLGSRLIGRPDSAVADKPTTGARFLWYALHPNARRIVVSNRTHFSTLVRVHVLGLRHGRTDVVRMRPNQVLTLRTRGERFISLSAARPVVVRYARSQPTGFPLAGSTVTTTGFVAGGKTTALAVYNPSSVPVRIRMAVTAGIRSVQRRFVVGPDDQRVFDLRAEAWDPRAIVLQSSLPVIVVANR